MVTAGQRKAYAVEASKDVYQQRLADFKKCGITFQKIAEELKIIAFSDIVNYLHVNESGSTKARSLDTLMPKASSRAIKKIREKRRIMETKGGEGEIILEDTFEFELYDKLDALKFLAGAIGITTTQKHEVTGKDGAPLSPLPFVVNLIKNPQGSHRNE